MISEAELDDITFAANKLIREVSVCQERALLRAIGTHAKDAPSNAKLDTPDDVIDEEFKHFSNAVQPCSLSQNRENAQKEHFVNVQDEQNPNTHLERRLQALRNQMQAVEARGEALYQAARAVEKECATDLRRGHGHPLFSPRPRKA